MAHALTPPFLLAALLLCLGGTAKLRSPDAAGRALTVVGLPVGSPVVRSALVRAFATVEVAVGVWCALSPGRLAAALLAGAFGLFTGLSLLLARERASCGCFGDGESPASPVQSVLSGCLALVAVGASITGPHGLNWIFGRPATEVGVLSLGIGGSVLATVLAYTELPRAWGSWSAR